MLYSTLSPSVLLTMKSYKELIRKINCATYQEPNIMENEDIFYFDMIVLVINEVFEVASIV